jgi:two-component system sensor histidine kinase BarA
LWDSMNSTRMLQLNPDPSSTYTILIVDDNALIRSLLSDLLAKYHLIKASSGEDALELLIKEPACKIDLLITDFELPGWSGIETLQRVKIICPNAKSILISGSHLGELKQFTSGGFDRALPKPVSNSELESTVEELLGEKATDPLKKVITPSTQQIQLPKSLLLRFSPDAHSQTLNQDKKPSDEKNG